MGTLEGKVALVTGAASGIGLACVARFVREGARVVGLVEGGVARLVRALGGSGLRVRWGLGTFRIRLRLVLGVCKGRREHQRAAKQRKAQLLAHSDSLLPKDRYHCKSDSIRGTVAIPQMPGVPQS